MKTVELTSFDNCMYATIIGHGNSPYVVDDILLSSNKDINTFTHILKYGGELALDDGYTKVSIDILSPTKRQIKIAALHRKEPAIHEVEVRYA